MNIYNKCTSKSYYVLVIDTTLASNCPLHFRKNLLEIIKKKILMATDDKIGRKATIQY